MTADDVYILGGATLSVVGGLFVILSRRFWADRAARSIWQMNPRTSERVLLVIGTLSVALGLFVLIMSVAFPVEPFPEVVVVEEPSCIELLLGALFMLGLGLYGTSKRHRLADRSRQYVRNTELLTKGYLVVGILFIIAGVFVAILAIGPCLKR